MGMESIMNISLLKIKELRIIFIILFLLCGQNIQAKRTEKPILHGKHWIAITGKPLGATAGARIFEKMRSSFGKHAVQPGKLLLNSNAPEDVRKNLINIGYILHFGSHTSGPINAIFFDKKYGTFWGGSSNHGDDYGIAW